MEYEGLFLLVVCAVAFAGQVTEGTGWDRRPETEDQALLRYVQDMTDKMARMEQRLEEQDVRIATLTTRVVSQGNTIGNLNTGIEEEKQISTKLTLKISEQQRVSEDLSARMMEQERVIQELRVQLDQHREASVVQYSSPQKSNEPSQDGEDNVVSGPQRAFQRAANKRSDDLGPVVSHLSQQVTELTAEIQVLKTADDEIRQARGTSYIRWGHASCPLSSELVYTGIVGGTHHTSNGGAGNYLCLTSDPVFDNHVQPSVNSYTKVFGSEYQICPETGCQTTPACAVCLVPRASSVMIPGTNRCSSGWTLEYSGYIMADYHGHSGSSEFICVDSSLGIASTSQHDDNENLLYYTHYRCGALPCPPYVDDKMVTCVVCSK